MKCPICGLDTPDDHVCVNDKVAQAVNAAGDPMFREKLIALLLRRLQAMTLHEGVVFDVAELDVNGFVQLDILPASGKMRVSAHRTVRPDKPDPYAANVERFPQSRRPSRN